MVQGEQYKMSRKRLPKGQRTLIDPEAQALHEFEQGMGESTLNTEIVCPFCAFRGKVRKFGTKKSAKSESYSTKMFQCPDCYQKMRRQTLLRDMTVSEWARYLYFDVIRESRGSGYNRISFPKLLERLKEYGWAREFWEAWRAAKESRGTSDVEDYLDYMKQSAEEARNMCGKFKQGLAGKNSMTCTTCEWHKTCWADVL